ncbi:DUF4328 domain-containing protein [uncultured Microscilla sp.]|uniref:DUF4328 domain-containing protein n=1 Tax=uncultured Microscilla sp. TaxID=432653 RepID=UPI00262A14B6|nr:DUF4328 domain-containing protein [uncultured Microscilla sp.]
MTKKRRLLKTQLLSGYLSVVLWISSIFKVLVLIGVALAFFLSSYMKSNELANTSSQGVQKGYSDEWVKFFIWAFSIHLVVLILVWFYRVYKNLQIIGIHTKYSPLWAPFSFFVWGFNLFVPYQVMQEVWAKTQRIGLSKEKARYIPQSSSLVVIWWVTWVLYTGLFIIVYVPPMFGIRPQLGMSAIIVLPIIINNIFLLSTILDITLLALITQIRRFEQAAIQRLRALKAQKQQAQETM